MLEHPNSSRQYQKGEIHNARPKDKGYRKEVSQNIKELAKEMKELCDLFDLNTNDLYKIVYEEFGEGIGYQTTRMFMDQVYGPAFRPRPKTISKYVYIVNYLKRLKKQFAKSEK